ncbi:MAG TPA: HesA/MoeB/ThiF family protein [Sunxiuqinia sp.]|nr:HesA/MoeB/ThiF family protein [Sunxiuqinia sp.]
MLTPEDKIRYSRQLSLQEIGEAGQQKLKDANVLVIGCGGLGSPALTYLAAAGVGFITIVDDDVVELNNLHRQTLYSTQDIGKKKVVLAAERLQDNNPNVLIETVDKRLTEKNAPVLFEGKTAILDCTDNYKTRRLIGEQSAALGIPLVFASVLNYEAQITVFNYAGGPAYVDLFPELPTDGMYKEEDIGLMGVLPGIAGAIQANELLKIVTGYGEVLSGKLLIFSILDNRFDMIVI